MKATMIMRTWSYLLTKLSIVLRELKLAVWWHYCRCFAIYICLILSLSLICSLLWRSFADQLVRQNAKHRFTFRFAIKLSKRKNNFTLFFGEPSCRVPWQRQICGQGYIRWIFTQNLEDIFAGSLLALLFSYFPFFKTISS